MVSAMTLEAIQQPYQWVFKKPTTNAFWDRIWTDFIAKSECCSKLHQKLSQIVKYVQSHWCEPKGTSWGDLWSVARLHSMMVWWISLNSIAFSRNSYSAEITFLKTEIPNRKSGFVAHFACVSMPQNREESFWIDLSFEHTASKP